MEKWSISARRMAGWDFWVGWDLFRVEDDTFGREEKLSRGENDLAGKEVFPGRVFLVFGEIGF